MSNPSPPSLPPKKGREREEISDGNWYRPGGKFLHLRSFTWSGNWAKSQVQVQSGGKWPSSGQSADASLAGAAVVTIKSPPSSPPCLPWSLPTHFSINLKLAKESQRQISFNKIWEVTNNRKNLQTILKKPPGPPKKLSTTPQVVVQWVRTGSKSTFPLKIQVMCIPPLSALYLYATLLSRSWIWPEKATVDEWNEKCKTKMKEPAAGWVISPPPRLGVRSGQIQIRDKRRACQWKYTSVGMNESAGTWA